MEAFNLQSLDAEGGNEMFRNQNMNGGDALAEDEVDPWAEGPGDLSSLPAFFGGGATEADQGEALEGLMSQAAAETAGLQPARVTAPSAAPQNFMSVEELEKSLAGTIATSLFENDEDSKVLPPPTFDEQEQIQRPQRLPEQQPNSGVAQPPNIPPHLVALFQMGWRPGMPLPRGMQPPMPGSPGMLGPPPPFPMGLPHHPPPHHHAGGRGGGRPPPFMPPPGPHGGARPPPFHMGPPQNGMVPPPFMPPSRPPAPKRMQWRDVDFIVRQQMKALRNLSYEDDYYFHTLNEKKIEAFKAAHADSTQSNNDIIDQVSGGRGTGQMRASKWAAMNEERCKAWAETKKTLGYVAKSNLRAPRQMLDLSFQKENKKKPQSSSKKNDGKEEKDKNKKEEEEGGKEDTTVDGDEYIAYKALQQPKWRVRARIERGISIIFQLEAKKVSNSKKRKLRGDLASVWSLYETSKNEKEKGEDTTTSTTSEWNGLELLKVMKGKKLLLRTLQSGILQKNHFRVLLEKAAQYLVHFVYSTSTDERDEDEINDLNERVTSALVQAYESRAVSLACLTKCIQLLTDSQTIEMIPYLLQFKASADVVRVLLVQGEAAAEKAANRSENDGEEEEENDAAADDAENKNRNPNWRGRNGSEDVNAEKKKTELTEAEKAEAKAKRAAENLMQINNWHAALDALKAKIAAGTAAGSSAD